MRYQIPAALLTETFSIFRQCGGGRRECQILWTSPWSTPETINRVVHPQHRAHDGGFELSSEWINDFWIYLARTGSGIRAQVHTHPHEAFHSDIDDAYPIIHSAGFLSLVIPDFALGNIGFERAYLAEIASNGRWRKAELGAHLEII